jgi:hypothetical protein
VISIIPAGEKLKRIKADEGLISVLMSIMGLHCHQALDGVKQWSPATGVTLHRGHWELLPATPGRAGMPK